MMRDEHPWSTGSIGLGLALLACTVAGCSGGSSPNPVVAGSTPATSMAPAVGAPPAAGQNQAPKAAASTVPGRMGTGAAGSASMPTPGPAAGSVPQPAPAAPSQPAAPGTEEPAAPPAASDELVDVYAPWEPACPDAFTPASGMNSGFQSDGKMRQFQVMLPSDTSSERPVFVALTGTEQSETAFLSQSGLGNLTQTGWIVLLPYRSCSTNGTSCNGLGEELSKDGRTWEPWFDGSVDDKFRQDQGPDVRFFESMVKCVAKQWPVDQKKIYLGGISAGGSITNRNMTFNSDFFAGGVNSSGMWFPVDGDWHPVDKIEDEREGWCCPRPLHTMDSSIVISIWGGDRDQWSNGRTSAVYAKETKFAGQYYGTQSKVVHVACSGSQGHSWPSSATTWFATTLLSHPKGTDPAAFKLASPPSGLNCVVGEYTDH